MSAAQKKRMMESVTPREPTRRRSRLRIAGLFSGIGGFEVGFRRAKHVTELLCEIDPAAQAVLCSRFPRHTLVSDVREIDCVGQGIDVLCAGFPCQDLSSVGQKVGIKGVQSSLVEEVFRILRNRPTEWVVLENVRFMLHLNRGAAMSSIVTALESLGYSWAYRVINSHSFAVPHRRHRVFFVASLHHDPREVLLTDNAAESSVNTSASDLRTPIGFYWTEGAYATGLAANSIPPLKGGSTIGIPSPPAILFPNGFVGTPDIRDAERVQGFDADWTIAAENVRRRSARWKLVGNAVTVNVAEWLGRKLREPLPYDASQDARLRKGSWPSAAWSRGDGRFEAKISDWPLLSKNVGLDTFLQFESKPLSARATIGFLYRAAKGNLRYPPGFLNALQAHCDRYPS